MNILIVEDEIIISAELSLLLQDMGFSVCGFAINYKSAIKLLAEKSVDLVMIDINLGGSKTGIDLADYINEKYNIPFIFLTSSLDKSTLKSALDTKPKSYLLKPFNKTEIYTSIYLALKNQSVDKKDLKETKEENLVINDAIFIKNRDFFVKVRLCEVMYFKSDKNYIEIVTNNKTYLIRYTLSNLLNDLPKNMFFKTHKSYVVNINKVSAINYEVIIIDEAKLEIPLSESFRKDLIKNFKIYS